MNVFDIPVLSSLLTLAATGLEQLGELVTPLGAIVLVTLAVRALLVPVGVSVARAARDRRRLAPRLAELQRRWKGNPERLQRETMALYAAEKVSPVAGCLPMLAQAPVVSLVYALFVLPQIGGEPNALLTAPALGTDLGRHAADALSGAVLGDVSFVAIAVVLAVIAWLNRRMMLRDAAAAPAGSPAVPAVLDPRGPLSWAPFLVLLAVAVVPLAASVYLVVSGAWACAERAVLRRLYR